MVKLALKDFLLIYQWFSIISAILPYAGFDNEHAELLPLNVFIHVRDEAFPILRIWGWFEQKASIRQRRNCTATMNVVSYSFKIFPNINDLIVVIHSGNKLGTSKTKIETGSGRPPGKSHWA
jgi:hypothetical protein